MERNLKTEFKVGVFVMVALVVGGILAFVIGSQRNLFESKSHYVAVFDSVGGLRPGSPVRIAGVNVGNVADVVLGQDARIHVEVSVVDNATHLVRVDSVAMIASKGMLGDRLVNITPGEGAPLPPGGTIPSEASVELAEMASRVGTMLDSAGGIIVSVQETADNLRAATEPFGDEQFATDVRETARNLAAITRLAANEGGVVHRLLADRGMAREVDQTLQNLQTASTELAASARSARSILDEVRTGDGTAHSLVYGQDGRRLVSSLADATGEAATLMRDVRTGDGTAHDLLYGTAGNDLLANMTEISRDIRAIVSDMRAGRGTLGGLLVDPSIYEDVKRLVGNLQRNEILRALVRYSIRRDDSPAAPQPADTPE